MVKKFPRPGLLFEEAILRFTKTLDSQAEVIFNHTVPDRDTGSPRQCDVWINAKFGGHYPYSILVSCKDLKRPINIDQIGCFCNEVFSTEANLGVIYSRAGFTKSALLKAKVNNISCCRIYQNEPADLPAAIFIEKFVCTPQCKLSILPDSRDCCDLKTWQDVFDVMLENDTILDQICKTVAENEEKAREEVKNTGTFPPDWVMRLTFTLDECYCPVTIQVVGCWKKYRAKVEATLLDGSYCMTNDSFSGTQFGPNVDMRGPHPGEGWIEMAESEIALPSKRLILVLSTGDVKRVFQENLASLPIYP